MESNATLTNRPNKANDEQQEQQSKLQRQKMPSFTENYLNLLNSDHLFSVMLSFIPVGAIFFIHSIISGILSIKDIGLSASFYVFLIILLLSVGNSIGYITLSSIMNLSIYWRSSFLSNIFFIGFVLAKQNEAPSLNGFGYYLMTLSFFHLSEYVFTALYNSKQVSTDSFLLNHSLEYHLAALASWLEFFIELYFFPSLKASLVARLVGLVLVLFGETFRKLAMYTAGSNFNHYVQENKQESHELVISGVYSLVRHPSYFGWFYWSIGTQILLVNPICIIAYTITSWKFFNTRIIYEEYYLRKFFGKKYVEYQKKVSIGIPMITGYSTKEENLD